MAIDKPTNIPINNEIPNIKYPSGVIIIPKEFILITLSLEFALGFSIICNFYLLYYIKKRLSKKNKKRLRKKHKYFVC